jgi:hypothetical protein
MLWKLAVAVGVILLALGVTEIVVESKHVGLHYDVVASPAGGMTAVEVGAGGAQATQVLPGAAGEMPIDGMPGVSVGPTLFLKPSTSSFISHGETEPAYWKLWWDGNAQLSASVSLQQDYDATDAQASFADLQQQLDNVAALAGDGYTFSSETESTVTGLSNGSGGVLEGKFQSDGGSTSVQSRYVLVVRGSLVALISMTAFGGSTDQGVFDSYASDEYQALNGPSTHTLLLWVAVAGGAVLLVVGLLDRSRRRSAAAPKTAPARLSVAAPMPYEPSGYGAAPPAYGAPPGYVAPPPSYGVTPPGFGTAGAGGYSPSGPAPYKSPPTSTAAWQQSGSPPPAGWYPDPSKGAPAGKLRYWDGTTWTYSTRDGLDNG